MAEKTKARSKISERLTKSLPLSSVALLLIGTSLGGQILGFLKLKLINGNFNTVHTLPSQNAGVFFAAFSIPDFFFYTIAAGALGVAVMPYLSDRLASGDRRGLWDLSTSILNLLAIVMFAVGIIMVIFARPLVEHSVGSGLTADQVTQAATLMRWISFDPLLFVISGILASTQQTLGRFFFYAVAPLFYNMSIIVSIYIFKDNLGIVGLGIGALIGAILQLVILGIGNVKLGFRWQPKILWHRQEFKSMLRNLPPRGLDQGMDQVQSITDTSFAGLRGHSGATAISNYNNAYSLHTAPILLIGTAISTAAFPRLNERLSQGRPDLFRKDFLMIIRAMIWITLPVIIVSYFARGYLARLVFSNNNAQISLIFGFLVGAIFFRIMYTIISRWFYARKDTITPLIVSVFTVGFNILLAYYLSQDSSYGVAGLAIAQSIVAVTEVAVLVVIMLVRDHKLFDWNFISRVMWVVSVSGFSVVAGFIMISLFPLGANDTGAFTLGGKLALITVVVFGVHIGVSALFGLDEVKPFLYRAKRFILKSVHTSL